MILCQRTSQVWVNRHVLTLNSDGLATAEFVQEFCGHSDEGGIRRYGREAIGGCDISVEHYRKMSMDGHDRATTLASSYT